MQTRLSQLAKALPQAEEAEAILRSCVHCGFCNATCPTHELLGDELDGPRGRIYLIKRALEDGAVSRKTQLHLDRCLACNSCETTCPSGVKYHRLLEIGRSVVDQAVPRGLGDRALRRALRFFLPRAWLFGILTFFGRLMRPLLPATLKAKLPQKVRAAGPRPAVRHARRVVLLEGCVQPALSPRTNAAAARVLDRLGISVVPAPGEACCGAVDYHLDAHEAGLARARRNVDAWIAALDAGAECIVQTASGCGAFVKEYGLILKDDPVYAPRAARVSAKTLDLAELVRGEPIDKLIGPGAARVAFHPPCTLQHGQKLGGLVEGLLRRFGFALTAVPDAHLCCGAAGTYSMMQPTLSKQLRDRRLQALESGKPELIVSANIGCQAHLEGAGRTPVRHWIELVDESMK